MIIGPRGLADGGPQVRRLSNVNILTHPLGMDPWAAAVLGRMTLPPDTFVQRLDAGARILRPAGVLDGLDGMWLTSSYDRASARLNLVPWTGTVTNLIPNSTMQGAVAGGASPNGWSQTVTSIGLTRSVVGLGTVGGVPYIDMRWVGTATGTYADLQMSPTINAATGERYTLSTSLALIGGSTAGLTAINLINYASPAFTDNASTNVIAGLTGALQRFATSRLLTVAGTTGLSPRLGFVPTNGAAIDITLRISAPQLVRIDVPGTFIPTSGAAASQIQTLYRFDLSEINNPTWTAWVPGVPGGFTGGGTSYLDTGANPGADFTRMALNSACYGVWIGSEVADAGFALGDTSNVLLLQPRSASNVMSARVHDASGISTGMASALGFSAGNRSGAAARQLFKNGIQVAADTGPATAMPSNLYLLRRLSTYYPGQVSAGLASASLNAAQQLAAYQGLAAIMGVAA